jgi:hypothetical protein
MITVAAFIAKLVGTPLPGDKVVREAAGEGDGGYGEEAA